MTHEQMKELRALIKDEAKETRRRVVITCGFVAIGLSYLLEQAASEPNSFFPIAVAVFGGICLLTGLFGLTT